MDRTDLPLVTPEVSLPSMEVQETGHDTGGADSDNVLRMALVEALQRLSLYERGEMAFQEHVGAVIARANEAVQTLERELHEQIHELRVERDRLRAELAASQAEIAHQRAQAARMVAILEEQTRQILQSLQHAGAMIAEHAGVEVSPERFVAPPSRRVDREEESGILTACWPEPEEASPAADASDEIALFIGRSLQTDGHAPPDAEDGPLPAFLSEEVGPIALPLAEMSSPEKHSVGVDMCAGRSFMSVRDGFPSMTTHIVLRPPPDPHLLASLRQGLEEVPGISRADLGIADEEHSTLRLTHAIHASPLAILMAVPDLDFRLISLEDDVVEIDLVDVGARLND